MSWVGIGAAVVGAGTSIYSTQQQKKAANKALDAQRQIAADVTYEPIDLEQLRAQATAAAIDNATNSLAIERASLPSCLEVSAWTDDGEIMGVRHRELAVEGVQFHPESILTEHGHRLLKNFLERGRS